MIKIGIRTLANGVKSTIPLISKNLPLTNQYNNKGYFAVAKKYVSRNTSRQQNKSQIIVKNQNLRFETSNYQINMYPFHPQIVKKTATVYQINKFSAVLALNFVTKTNQQQSNQQKMKQTKQNWQNRKSISFKFNELSQLIAVDKNQQRQWVIQNVRTYKSNTHMKKITFKNNKKQYCFDILFEQFIKSQGGFNNLWKIQTKMNYAEFQMMQFIIKESLFDLSGMKFVLELKRAEELAKINVKDRQELDKDDLFKNYDSKDAVV